jgi:hypothetical protein
VRLAELAGAAIAFVAIKRLTDAKPTAVTATPAAKPLIQQGFVTGPAATGQDFSILPKSLAPTQVGPSIDPLMPTGPIKQPSADIPKFVPFDILGGRTIDKSKLPKEPLPTNFFQTGIFDPAVQAKLRARK